MYAHTVWSTCMYLLVTLIYYSVYFFHEYLTMHIMCTASIYVFANLFGNQLIIVCLHNYLGIYKEHCYVLLHIAHTCTQTQFPPTHSSRLKTTSLTPPPHEKPVLNFELLRSDSHYTTKLILYNFYVSVDFVSNY